MGRVLARAHGRCRHRRDPGAEANDELTELLLKKLRAAGVKELQCIFTNELDVGDYLAGPSQLTDRRPARREGLSRSTA